ncbi:uncharacterized protein LOC125464490 [Stegostoma tigrinum]|uniref:uncharacterized protein LOC125464490 n=1 Tax=Stegostoma tigrinum TaxID=3053191 RepID=UPI00286FDD7E|nr:uncharacterized protein LOC125464490 [Stegostoma tigrinum]
MEAIQLITLAILADSLGGTTIINSQPTMVSEQTNSNTPTSLDNSSASTEPWLNATTPTIASTPSSDLPNTSLLTNTPRATSQFTSEVSSEVQSIRSATSQSTSHLTTKHKWAKSTLMTSITSRSAIKQQNNAAAGRIIAYVIGGVLLVMLITVCVLLLCKRHAKRPSEDQTWAGICPGPTGEIDLHPLEDNDNNVVLVKRPSLTTFLSKKSKRESLLDDCSMEVLQSEGIVNASSPKIEEKLFEAEVKVESETAKERQPSSETQSHCPPLEAESSVKDHDATASSPAIDTEDPGPDQEVPEIDPSTSFPPPPEDFLDLVNDSDNPPLLLELQV